MSLSKDDLQWPEREEAEAGAILADMRCNEFNKALGHNLAENELLYSCGEAYQHKQYANALAFAWRAIDLDANSWMAYHALGNIYRFFGEELHKPHMGKITSLSGNATKEFLEKTVRWKGYYKKSCEMFKKAIEINNENSETWYEIGVTHGRLGELNEAKDALANALKLNPSGDIGKKAQDAISEIQRIHR